MKTRLYAIVLSLWALLGCAAETPPADGQTSGIEESRAPACEPLAPRASPAELYVMPAAGPTPFLSALNAARRTIRVMIYELGNGPILDTLAGRAREGVDVRVILDVTEQHTNEPARVQLERAGASVVWSDPAFEFMHAKVMVVDDETAIVSTGNYGAYFMRTARDFVVKDTDRADVDVLTALFDADFTRSEPNLACTRLLVSPVNAKERLLAFLASAKQEILVETMQLADRDVRETLAERKAAGVDVRVVLADQRWITANARASAFLEERGIPSRQLRAPSVHAKSVIVDGRAAYVGSINFSRTSLTQNREVGLLVTEQTNIAALRTTFEKDWSDAE